MRKEWGRSGEGASVGLRKEKWCGRVKGLGLGLACHREGGGSAECLRRGNPTSDPPSDPNPNPNPTSGVFPENEVFLLG